MSTTNNCLNISDRDPNKLNNSSPDYNVHDGSSNYETAKDAFFSIEYNRTNCFILCCI